MEIDKKRLSHNCCCVVGCNNSYENSNVTLYRFPNKPYEVKRRQIWIDRVRRITDEGKTWQPTPTSKICSEHFVGNKKSSIQNSPSYNPTIFPNVYKTFVTNPKQRSLRFHRATNKRKILGEIQNVCTTTNQSTSKAFSRQPATMEFKQEDLQDICTPIEKNTTNFSCQVNMNFENNPMDSFLFDCTFSKESNDVAVQANVKNYCNIKSQSNKCVGNNDSLACKGFFGIKSIPGDKEMNSVCGVTTSVFTHLFGIISIVPHANQKLSIENQLVLFLMKLKLGLTYCALSVFFDIHYSSVSRLFINMLYHLSQKMFKYIPWLTRNEINSKMPSAFHEHYPNCRVIIDCTEIAIEQPKSVENRIYTYSHYKSKHTAKFLIGIAPSGVITFLSKCYGGRSSDGFITNDCGILSLLEPGDVVLADKGFPGIKCKDDVIIVMPPFVHDGVLTAEEVEDTCSIASVRIHVERSIQRIKTYNILQKIPEHLFHDIDKIVFMCGVLTNLQPPIINMAKDFDEET